MCLLCVLLKRNKPESLDSLPSKRKAVLVDWVLNK